MAMLDRDLRYLSVSHDWLVDFNLQSRDLRGLHHYDVFPDLPERWHDVHRRALSGEVVRCLLDKMLRADGSEQWVRWEVRPWIDSQDDIGGIIIFREDLSEMKRAEDSLRNDEQQLRLFIEQIRRASPDYSAEGV